jgi:hypothetical protein
VLVAAAVCPHPPLLVPEVTGSAATRSAGAAATRSVAAGADGDRDGIGEVRAGCDAAVAGLTVARPDLIVVVGGAAAGAVYDGAAAGSLRAYGVGYTVGTGEPVLPLSLTVGAWLLRRAGLLDAGDEPPASARLPTRLRAVARTAPVAECLRLGAEIARQAPRVAMLVMGDGPGRRAVGPVGADDPAADRYSAEVAAALAAADPARLARLAPSLDDELVVSGRAAWQVLAGAADGQRLRGQLRCAASRYEVSYLVASWDVIR